MRLRDRTAPADSAAADAWIVEAGVRFDVSSSAEERWKYHGDVAGTGGHGGVTPHGFGFSLSAQVEPPSHRVAASMTWGYRLEYMGLQAGVHGVAGWLAP